ncbi:MAG: signal recognition particle protein [Heliobacteriaceae bacterium]|jgi:signal recognition particle subunit SRP54|nr:signal recognition particle protein [Heliobacteriaceae bacterium]
MFDNLSDKLQKIISGTKELTQDNMTEALREVRRALLEADVNLRVVKAFISAVKDKAEGENIVQGVNASEQLVKIVHDELVEILGKTNVPLDFSGSPNIIMMLGLQGSGKTTSSAKLAVKLKKEGRNPLLAACDVYRPAAVSQLQTLGKQTGIEVFAMPDSKDVQAIVRGAIEHAKANDFNTIILDTAGRLQIDTNMMAELLLIDRIFHPTEKLLVIDAMTGQEAVNVAENFDAQLGLTGLVLTKLDGDSRGGAALSVVYCTGKPIKLTGTGEKIDALEDFHPERIASRILGMGDIVSLVERAQEVFDEKQARELEEKMKKAEFSFDDFLKMQKQMKAFGSIDSLLGMIPGMKIGKDDRQKISHMGEQQFKKMEVFIQSMTPAERANPQLINSSRKKRISKGSGIPIQEVNQFIQQFDQMRMMMKGMSNMKGMLGKMGGGDPMKALGGKMGKHNMNKAMSMMRKFK